MKLIKKLIALVVIMLVWTAGVLAIAYTIDKFHHEDGYTDKPCIIHPLQPEFCSSIRVEGDRMKTNDDFIQSTQVSKAESLAETNSTDPPVLVEETLPTDEVVTEPVVEIDKIVEEPVKVFQFSPSDPKVTLEVTNY
jgi:hypothetical protein